MRKHLTYLLAGGILSPLLVFADTGNCPGYGFGGSMMGGGGFLGGVLTLILWVLVTIGLFYLVKFFAQGAWKSSHKEEDALEILKKRYVKGEIQKEEFEDKKKELQL